MMMNEKKIKGLGLKAQDVSVSSEDFKREKKKRKKKNNEGVGIESLGRAKA